MSASAFALDKNIVVCNIIHVLTLNLTVTTCGGVHTSYMNKILAHVNMICICYNYTTTLAIPSVLPTLFLLPVHKCTHKDFTFKNFATCLEGKVTVSFSTLKSLKISVHAVLCAFYYLHLV